MTYKSIIILIIIFLFNTSTAYSDNNLTNNLLICGYDKNTNYNYSILLSIDMSNKRLDMKYLDNIYFNQNIDLMIKQIYSKYKLNIDNYVLINKKALESIISEVKGIYMNNIHYSSYNLLYLLDNTNFSKFGLISIHLNMIQGIIYSLSNISYLNYPTIIKNTYPLVRIDITPFEMLSLAFDALSLPNYHANKYILYD